MISSVSQSVPAEWEELIEDLRALDRACGPSVNKHDRVTILIVACIDQDINTRASIIAVLRQLGFNPRHVAIMLKSETGDNPERHRWRRDEMGTYSLID